MSMAAAMRSLLLGSMVLGHVAARGSPAPTCKTVLATATDPAMRWHCQGRGVRGCTGQHIACSPPVQAPAAATAAASKGLVIFLPGTRAPGPQALVYSRFR